MAGTLSTTTANAMLQAIITAIDAGADVGYFEIHAAAATLIHMHFVKPSFNAPANAHCHLDNDPARQGTATAQGTATHAHIFDSDGNGIFDGLSVGVGSEQVQLSTLGINIDDVLTLTGDGVTLTMPTATT